MGNFSNFMFHEVYVCGVGLFVSLEGIKLNFVICLVYRYLQPMKQVYDSFCYWASLSRCVSYPFTSGW